MANYYLQQHKKSFQAATDYTEMIFHATHLPFWGHGHLHVKKGIFLESRRNSDWILLLAAPKFTDSGKN